MTQDRSPQTSKDGRSSRSMSPEEEYGVALMSRSRKRNLTPLQRRQLANLLRMLRRERSQDGRWDRIDYNRLHEALIGTFLWRIICSLRLRPASLPTRWVIWLTNSRARSVLRECVRN